MAAGVDEDSSAEALAKDARNRFERGDTSGCLKVLGFIQKKRPDDRRVLHNINVANYYMLGCRHADQFIDSMNTLVREGETTAAAKSDDKADENDRADDELDDFDPALTKYNQAVVYFQTKQYSKAHRLLSDLFKQIEPLQEGLVLRICFALVDCCLYIEDTDRASLVLGYVEKEFGNAMKEQSKPPTMTPLTNAFDNLEARIGGDESKQGRLPVADVMMAPGELKAALHYYKAKLNLLSANPKQSKREIKVALSVGSGPTPLNASSLFLKAKLEYLRQNYRKSLKMLTGCWRETPERGLAGPYFNNVACVHHRLRKHTLAAMYLQRALREGDRIYESQDGKRTNKCVPAFASDRRAEMCYNLGIQMLMLGRPEVAFDCFQESSLVLHHSPRLWLRLAECCVAAHARKLRTAQESSQENLSLHRVPGRRILLPRPSSSVSSGVPVEEPTATVSSFLSASEDGVDPSFFTPGGAPRTGTLSLEYALKCQRNCLFLLSQSLQTQTLSPSFTLRPTSPAAKVSSLGPAGSLSLADEALDDPSAESPWVSTNADSTESELASSVKDFPGSNAGSKVGGTASSGATSSNNSGNITTAASAVNKSDTGKDAGSEGGSGRQDVLTAEEQLVRQAALCLMAYTCLACEDPSAALSATTALLKEDAPMNQYRFLGHMYAAEALCALNRPLDALQHVSPSVIQASAQVQAPALLPTCSGARSACAPSSGPMSNHHFTASTSSTDAKAMVFSNMAVALLLSKELEQAGQCVEQALAVAPSAPQVILTATYYELRLGHTEKALDLLREKRFCLQKGRAQSD